MRVLLHLAACALFAQTPSFREGELHGRRVFILDNGVVRVATTRGGGFIGEIRFVDGDAKRTVNPMRIPHYPTIDPWEYDPAKHAGVYGTDSQKRLMAAYMGHYLCFPHYGPPSSARELELGYNNHGEAILVEWKVEKSEANAQGVTLRYGAVLPQTQYRVAREFVLPAKSSVVHVQEWVENLATYDRPINWVQHVTFGPPFAEPGKNFLDANVAAAVTSGDEGSVLQWRDELRPFDPTPKSGRYRALLLDRSRKESWFTSYHANYNVLIGYLFDAALNPWIGDWQENQRSQHLPWSGKAIARGLEWGTSPFAEGLKKTVERGQLLGAPAYRWIGGKETLTQKYDIFLAPIPDGFQGVADIRRENGRIVVVERGAGRVTPI